LMNMCMIHDAKRNRVVVLDKVVKEGWEGLTFPGGHIEDRESVTDSVIREVMEETGLEIENPQYRGIIHWLDIVNDRKQIGFLYYTDKFKGELIEGTDEGEVYWMDFDKFIQKKNKSLCMDDCLKIYLNENINEAITIYDGKRLSEFKFY
ncbi:MAG: NUDIX domain-containing protein, partial [Tissierellia bacterium]|nr:NUDIX domain-containing protein [Tissierellia bacterium]